MHDNLLREYRRLSTNATYLFQSATNSWKKLASAPIKVCRAACGLVQIPVKQHGNVQLRCNLFNMIFLK